MTTKSRLASGCVGATQRGMKCKQTDGQQSSNALALDKDMRKRASSPRRYWSYDLWRYICGYKFGIAYQNK